MSRFYVYALRDPSTGERRYVGMSANPAKRLSSHTSRSAAGPMRDWVARLSGPPQLDLLEGCDSETDARVAEQRWIAQLKVDGARLINVRVGGETKSSARGRHFFGCPERLRSARKSLGWTIRRLSRESGVDATCICRCESGERDQVTAETAVLLARALGKSVEWLVTGTEREIAPQAAE